MEDGVMIWICGGRRTTAGTTSLQPSGFYNAKRRSFRQARRRTMAGNISVYSARDDGSCHGAHGVFGMANPAQRPVRVQFSPPGNLKFTPFGPQRTLYHKGNLFARHNPKFVQNLLRIIFGRVERRAARWLGRPPWMRSR
jgi:hypothetical protein